MIDVDFDNWPLVESHWLEENLANPILRIVDARWRGDGSGFELYRRGHIPGALHLDWHKDLNHSVGRVNDLLLPPDKFAAVMAKNGISNDSVVIAYADQDYSGAARLWWGLRLYGHKQVALLNGGFDKWTAEQRPSSEEISHTHRTQFIPDPQPDWLATIFELREALADQEANVCLVDTRPEEQYSGMAVWTPTGSRYLPAGKDWITIEGQRMRAGHIPGAVHLESSLNLDADKQWTYLSADELLARPRDKNIGGDQRVITYCGVGISGSLGLFSLYLAGYRNLGLYDASWSEWGTDPALPVEIN